MSQKSDELTPPSAKVQLSSKKNTPSDSCATEPVEKKPQVSSTSAKKSKPLAESEPAKQHADKVYEIPNRFPTPEEIEHSKKCKKEKNSPTLQKDSSDL